MEHTDIADKHQIRFAINIQSMIWLLFVVLVTGCAKLPVDYPKHPSFILEKTSDTNLGITVNQWELDNGGKSGFYPLQKGSDAFAARLRMIERAEVSLDLQSFQMKSGMASHILAAELLIAADRGVRVRFLLDDIFSTVSVEELFILDAHSDIEVRLYNPIARQGVFYLNFLGDFKRANRRMHNKSFTADNKITIVGGRNIADEYFDLNSDTQFEDFDLIGFGQVAKDVGETFDLFWNSKRSLPLDALSVQFTTEHLEKVRQEMIHDFSEAHASIYAEAMRTPMLMDLLKSGEKVYPAEWKVVTDHPKKLKKPINQNKQKLANHLNELKKLADEEIIVITPYFVPLKSGLEFWKSIADKGVRVVILTNSLASTNHIAVHSGYSKYRKQLIKNGIELYEARVDAFGSAQVTFESPDSRTLHTKLIIIDREIVFAGSLNLDPRSIEINAELGLSINSSDLAKELVNEFFSGLPYSAYRLTLDGKGNLAWESIINGETVIEHCEPNSSYWRRWKAWFLKIVPDSQL